MARTTAARTTAKPKTTPSKARRSMTNETTRRPGVPKSTTMAKSKPVKPAVVAPKDVAPKDVAKPVVVAVAPVVAAPVTTPPSTPPSAPPVPQRIGPRPSMSPLRPNLPPPTFDTNLSFKIGDKAVHPSHGLGEISAIEHRELGGTKGLFYIMKILDNGMKVMVPVDGAAQAGLRCVMSSKEAEAVLNTMRAREVAVDVQPWSRRFRAYTEMIKSGSPHEIAKVLRDMHRLKFDKDLSFGERRLLDQAKSLLMKELALAKKMPEQKMAEQIASIFQA